jgi:glucose/arabinose dehydrogenase
MLAALAGACASPLPFRMVKVATVSDPTAIVAVGDKLWVTEQAGRIHEVGGGQDRILLDIRRKVSAGGERGLLGLAVGPRTVVNYTYTEGKQLRTRIATFEAKAGVLDAASEVEVLSFDQPWANHNSGALAFGPDGMLYAGVGDGGSGGDPRKTGQDPSDLLGSILRIDVRTAPYVVPADNPRIPGARPEVWAYGVRNPWGMHFDGATLWWGDVGQNKYEEVDRGVAGGNYGWNAREAGHCYAATPCEGAYVEPVAEYGRNLGSSVTGGLVYRGPSIPVLDGRYVFADFVSGRLFAVPPEGGARVTVAETEMHPSCFAEDASHRLYIGDYQGIIWRVDPAG